MRILKILYICWIILCVVGWFISPIVGHNPNRVEEFFYNAWLDSLSTNDSQSMAFWNNKN
ncbi:hypothetical protein OLU59_02125 [Campylobacter jejuni]|nr:hypothetical protein [Campylobacter jejuni]